MCETWMEDTRLLGRKLSANWKVCMRKFFISSSFYYFFFFFYTKVMIMMLMMACVWKDSFDCITSTNEFSFMIVVVFLADFDAASYTTFPFRRFFSASLFYKKKNLYFILTACLPACCVYEWRFSFLFHYIIICFSAIIWGEVKKNLFQVVIDIFRHVLHVRLNFIVFFCFFYFILCFFSSHYFHHNCCWL